MTDTVPVDKVVVGENPRTFFDPDAQEQLERNIKAMGLLVPITVVPDGDEFRLVAGERRLRAYKSLGIEEIPAFVTSGDKEAAKRIAENVVRSDLHPIEEGRAYVALLVDAKGKPIKPATLAKQLGIPAARIVGRVRLAQLPTAIADQMISGHPIDRLRDVLTEMVEKLGPQLTEEFVEANLDALPDCSFVSEVHDLMSKWLMIGHDKPVVEGNYASWKALPNGQELHDALCAKGAQKWEADRILGIDHEDEDAARAYGVLAEFIGQDTYQEDVVYITDKVWMADRLALKVEQYEKPRDAAKPAPKVDAEGNVEPPDEAEIKAEKRRIAAAAKAEREERGRINQAFGIQLERSLAKRKLTLNDAKLLATLALHDENTIGLAWQMVKPNHEVKGGDRWQKAKTLTAWVKSGKTADQVIGRLFQVILASMFHDEGAVVKSHRCGHGFFRLERDEHIMSLLRSAAPPELFAPINEEWIKEQERQAQWEKEEQELLAKQKIRDAQAAEEDAVTEAETTENTNGETTQAAGEIEIGPDLDPDGDMADALATSDQAFVDDHIIGIHVGDPVVSDEEVSDPLPSELVATNGALVDAGELSTNEVDELTTKALQEAQIQQLKKQSEDALQAELARAEQDRVTEEVAP